MPLLFRSMKSALISRSEARPGPPIQAYTGTFISDRALVLTEAGLQVASIINARRVKSLFMTCPDD